MQHMDTAQVSPGGGEQNPSNLLRPIPRIAASISQQHQELAELKEALRKIIQAYPHAAVAADFSNMPPQVSVSPSHAASSSGPWVALPEIYYGNPETLQGFTSAPFTAAGRERAPGRQPDLRGGSLHYSGGISPSVTNALDFAWYKALCTGRALHPRRNHNSISLFLNLFPIRFMLLSVLSPVQYLHL